MLIVFPPSLACATPPPRQAVQKEKELRTELDRVHDMLKQKQLSDDLNHAQVCAVDVNVRSPRGDCGVVMRCV